MILYLWSLAVTCLLSFIKRNNGPAMRNNKNNEELTAGPLFPLYKDSGRGFYRHCWIGDSLYFHSVPIKSSCDIFLFVFKTGYESVLIRLQSLALSFSSLSYEPVPISWCLFKRNKIWNPILYYFLFLFILDSSSIPFIKDYRRMDSWYYSLFFILFQESIIIFYISFLFIAAVPIFLIILIRYRSYPLLSPFKCL